MKEDKFDIDDFYKDVREMAEQIKREDDANERADNKKQHQIS